VEDDDEEVAPLINVEHMSSSDTLRRCDGNDTIFGGDAVVDDSQQFVAPLWKRGGCCWVDIVAVRGDLSTKSSIG
jgi:hypothetical protein